MKKAYDVIIIGGGIIGCATAFELAKRGICLLYTSPSPRDVP